MKRLFIATILLLLHINNAFSQRETQMEAQANIKATILNFLNWHKRGEPDSTYGKYSLTKGGYPDSTTKTRIDFNGVAIQMEQLRKSGFFSETFINNLQQYFVVVDKILAERNLSPDLLRIPELDDDFILNTIEPEEVLTKINDGKFDKIELVFNKAIVRFCISKYAVMIFTLTKVKNDWKIDYIGWDTSSKYSVGTQ
jgi:hypothetical protein